MIFLKEAYHARYRTLNAIGNFAKISSLMSSRGILKFSENQKSKSRRGICEQRITLEDAGNLWRILDDSSAIFLAAPTVDPCVKKYCGVGRECEPSSNNTVATCVCTRKCPRRHRPVCASNGKIYANHCELHRAACHAGSSLTRSRLMRCLHHGKISSARGTEMTQLF